jgi:capsular polysaccharide biosynthesis protein
VRTTGNPLVKITVEASTRRRAAAAANALAGVVVDRLAPYADRKIDTLKKRIADDQAQIDAIRRAASSGDPVAKAVLAVQIGDVLDDQLQAKQLLIQAQEIERPKVLTRAASVKTTARSKRNSVVVAAFLGFLIGLIVALLWEPLVRARR